MMTLELIQKAIDALNANTLEIPDRTPVYANGVIYIGPAK